jgi:hypothetical protein
MEGYSLLLIHRFSSAKLNQLEFQFDKVIYSNAVTDIGKSLAHLLYREYNIIDICIT